MSNEKQMKVLLVGCGSVGRRHLINLISLPQVGKIIVYSKVRNYLSGLKDKNKISRVESLDDIQADWAIIANETYKHVPAALILAKKGIPLFIEKPLAQGLSRGLERLKKIAIRKNVQIGVGYNLRFLGALRFVKTILSRRALGNIYFVKIEVGQYLPAWRNGRDYRVSYSAFKKRGGGVALDLSHEIDYMRYLFGEPRFFKALKLKVSDLKIDSEDIFEGLYAYDGFICGVHMDYLQKKPRRIIRIEARNGSLVCDLIGKKIVMEINGKKKIVAGKKLFDLDKTYMLEILSFMKSIENHRKPEVTFEDGVKVLKLIEAQHV